MEAVLPATSIRVVSERAARRPIVNTHFSNGRQAKA